MRRESILILAFALSLAGLFALALAARSQKPQYVPISELGDDDVGRLVEVRGELTSVVWRKGALLLKVCSGKCVRVFASSATVASISDHEQNLRLLERGQLVSVSGELVRYRGELEIALRSVRVVG
mgnify:CR=1 FL=1